MSLNQLNWDGIELPELLTDTIASMAFFDEQIKRLEWRIKAMQKAKQNPESINKMTDLLFKYQASIQCIRVFVDRLSCQDVLVLFEGLEILKSENKLKRQLGVNIFIPTEGTPVITTLL